ncbi:hypothetical protein K461DRAFT_73717 [Myriangium duriaei CBS 260.36]|uniref:Uncharacterized protein n=1 Tax=Myriangium duriaei CBS 260.36 TaxID=1168546 RepID=A0A9P4IU85_9PEZI|nr:hypothetical protein K461DRAFT_73717 [Myriangium duriaei CBS 260.36]
MRTTRIDIIFAVNLMSVCPARPTVEMCVRPLSPLSITRLSRIGPSKISDGDWLGCGESRNGHKVVGGQGSWLTDSMRSGT